MAKKNKNDLPQKTDPQSAPPGNQDSPQVFLGEWLEHFSGPYPPPSVLKGYQEINPDLANKVISWTEAEQKHRHEMEKTDLSIENRNSLLGIIFGFLIGVIGLVGGTYAIISGYPVSGTFVGGGSIAAIISTFIKGTQRKEKENTLAEPPAK